MISYNGVYIFSISEDYLTNRGGLFFMESKEKIKSIQSRKKNRAYRLVFAMVFITLIFILIAIFAVGRTVAHGSSEARRVELYTFLCDNDLTWLSNLIFGDNIPLYSSELPPAAASVADDIKVAFSSEDQFKIKKILLSESGDGFSGVLLAINDPRAISIGRSTQESNDVSGIRDVEHASTAFSFADSRHDSILYFNGEEFFSEDDNGSDIGYFGFNESGILHFGEGTIDEIRSLGLSFATRQVVSALITSKVPCSFEMSRGEIGKPSLSVAQCADGSVMLLFANGSASCKELTELLYRYSAVNAAIIYIGNGVGFIDSNDTYAFGEGFLNAKYSSVWMIK